MVPQKLILANRRDKDIHKYRRCRDDEASYQTQPNIGTDWTEPFFPRKERKNP